MRRWEKIICTVIPWYPRGIASKTFLKNQNPEMLKSLIYKDVEQGNFFTSADSQPRNVNTVFNPQLVESVDMKPGVTEGRLYIY